jgi:hypothetical protein
MANSREGSLEVSSTVNLDAPKLVNKFVDPFFFMGSDEQNPYVVIGVDLLAEAVIGAGYTDDFDEDAQVGQVEVG